MLRVLTISISLLAISVASKKNSTSSATVPSETENKDADYPSMNRPILSHETEGRQKTLQIINPSHLNHLCRTPGGETADAMSEFFGVTRLGTNSSFPATKWTLPVHHRVINQARAFRVRFSSGLDFESLSGLNRARGWSKIDIFSE